MKQTKLLYYAALAWTLVIFAGCSIPGNGLPPSLTTGDKVMHILIFLGFGFLWSQAGYGAWTVLLAGVGYGMLTEIWQGIMPIDRSFDLYDALADTIGTVLGIGLAWMVKAVVSRSSRRS